MPKAYLIEDEKTIVFDCPGCLCSHAVGVKPGSSYVSSTSGNPWKWNGSLDAPTLSPSVHYRDSPVCHSIVTDGKIQFCGDSQHKLANQTVPLPDIEEN
jgi:hypothetical protein